MNIHKAVLQPIAAAFVYCNRQAAAGRRRKTKVGNFRAPAVSLKLFYDGTARETK